MSQETITVRLKNVWFAPTTSWKKSPLQSMSGRRFKKGTYVWPAHVRKYLPKSAEIVNDDTPEVEDPFDGEGFDGYHEDDTFSEDLDRAGSDELQRIEDQADKDNKLTKSPEQILAERQANLRKANEARQVAAAEKAEARRLEVEGEANGAPDADAPEAPAVDEGPSEILVEEDGDTVEF